MIPLGFIHEQFCFDYINNGFEGRDSYKLKPSKKIQIKEDVQFWVSINEYAVNVLRNKVINSDIFYHCPVLGIGHLPESIDPPALKSYSLYRINQVFARVSHYQNLRENAAPTANNKPKYFNILS